ncbi:MAG: hypothetical protein H7Z12_15930 [Rhodospirillaceae bacterium]|nr:hypothetical protein [Rhodospirillales bacterium]
MPKLAIAHLREQGQDMVIVPLDSHFRYKTEDDQREIIEEIQEASMTAGLAGIVVPVWDNGGGRMGFIAPRNWHPFFKSINLRVVQANINKELSW